MNVVEQLALGMIIAAIVITLLNFDFKKKE
ncbi:hypothetical protein DFP97_122107 [Paenibacillus prosopidis]|uniref:Holin-like toxin n=1 Tax=Paenibacillus prosopidis TaxID=630520 RepID=A0A368VMJ8_9BACL|nr:hypothetical protein DFP97_122107 [Paenibacillus prosopidis]